jgi:phosphatidylethanolamine-binding protein (PEBP) family uncharacterized protein
MWRQTIARASTAGLAAVALAGCSNSSSAPKTVTIPFKSPAVVRYTLPARYTCEGKNVAPPLEWGAVPSTTHELAVFMLALTPNGGGGYRTTVAWALAGVNPQLHRLAAGELPPGAHVAVTNVGKPESYSVCPPKGHTQAYQFALYAVPAAITVPDAFVGLKLLAVLGGAESTEHANAGGAFVASYTRPGRKTASATKHAGG